MWWSETGAVQAKLSTGDEKKKKKKKRAKKRSGRLGAAVAQ